MLSGVVSSARFPVLVVLLFCTYLIPSSHAFDDDDSFYYIIQNTASGLVVEAGNPTTISIQYFTGYLSQLWRFDRGTRPGFFYMVNKGYGTVLTADSGNGQLSLTAKDGSSYKQWFLHSGGQIVNVAFNKVLDIPDADYYPGNRLQLYNENGSKAQIFNLQLYTRMMSGFTEELEPKV